MNMHKIAAFTLAGLLSGAAFAADSGWPTSFGVSSETVERSAVRTAWTSCGCMTTPSFANAPPTIAICSGVTRVSYCPIEVVASCASSRSSPIREGVTPIGIERSWPKPNSSAVMRSWSCPISTPSMPKEVLHDWRSASASVDSSSGPHGSWRPAEKLFIVDEEFGSSYFPGPGITDSAV